MKESKADRHWKGRKIWETEVASHANIDLATFALSPLLKCSVSSFQVVLTSCKLPRPEDYFKLGA